MTLIILSILLAGFLLLLGLLEFWSYPGKPAPFVDEKGAVLPNSISKKIFVEINGVRQGMIIRGKVLNNPLLLYVHGGMPDTFLNQRYPTRLEEYFTVVWWELRGARDESRRRGARSPVTCRYPPSPVMISPWAR